MTYFCSRYERKCLPMRFENNPGPLEDTTMNDANDNGSRFFGGQADPLNLGSFSVLHRGRNPPTVLPTLRLNK